MIHPSSDVQSGSIGNGTRVWQYVVILPNAVIGERCNICSHVFIENDVIVGNQVTIKCGVQIWDGCRIEDHVFVGPNVTFTNDMYPRSQQHPERFTETHIRHHASIGANSTIRCGVTIGEYSMIGCGSVVTRNVGAYELWYGVPARHSGYVTPSGEVLDLSLCSRSGKSFRLTANGLEEK